MTLLFSAIIFVVMFLLVSAAEAFSVKGSKELFKSEENGTLKSPVNILKELVVESSGRAIVIGLVPAVVNFLLTMAPDLAVLFAVMLLGTMFYLCWWWQKDFESIPEFITFALQEVLLFWELKATSNVLVSKMKLDGLGRSIVTTLPVLLLIGTLGFFLVSAMAFHKKITQKRVFAVATIAVLVLTAATFIRGGDVPKVQAEEGPWYHFYNSDLQNDTDKDNDFNFGPSAYKEKLTAKEADKEFRERIKKDPALGAADMAWFDAIMKTRYIGVFYDEAAGQWDAAINKAKDGFLADEGKYKEAYGAFFLYLDKATKVEIVERTSGLDDQMYMNPVTVNKIPDVIVLQTENHKGHFLKYTFKIKDKEITVEYRLECGFQPCNVEKIMGITPTNKKAVAKTSTSTPTPTPSPDPNPNPDPTPTPTPTPTPVDPDDPNPSPRKDPSDSKVKPLDDPGPGENTNNPENPNESKKDNPTNSNHGTKKEYDEKIEDIKKANEEQKVGGDPNTPTTPTPSDTTVHDNAENGTGNGGVGTPTPVSEPAKAAEDTPKTDGSGETTKAGDNISSKPGTAWGGPKD